LLSRQLQINRTARDQLFCFCLSTFPSSELWEKCEIPPLLQDFQAQWESPLFGLFHAAPFSIAHLPTNSAIEPSFFCRRIHTDAASLNPLTALHHPKNQVYELQSGEIAGG
jgi:hypothetical protein